MKWSQIVRESEEQWVKIEDLPPDQQKIALAAFAKLADDQRGVPEDLGGGGRGNPDIFFASGAFTWLTEHVGDLTHRMTARGHEQIAYGYDYVGPKVDRALRTLKHGYGIDREVSEQIKRNHEYRTEQGETDLPLTEWQKRVREAGWRYTNAHQQLIVFNRAQWLARESAVALGEMNWSRATFCLDGLLQELESPERWTAFASQVRVGPNGQPLSFRSP